MLRVSEIKIKQYFQIDDFQYNLVWLCFNLPGFLFPILGGKLLSILPVRICIIYFGVLILAGSIIWYSALIFNEFNLIYLAAVIIGMSKLL